VAAQGLTLASLRCRAVNQSLFTPATLADAIDRLGFVQADPIRAPARAQDLILRHRVSGYRAGDLERQYESLDIEEDHLYAYGFVSKQVWQLLHPRKTPPMRAFEKKVLDTVTKLGEAHPRALDAHLGTRRVVNAWGGFSKATTHALEWLHWRGALRIARRENGIRVYRPLDCARGGPASMPDAVPSAAERLRSLIMVYARIFAPSPERSLQAVIARHRELGNTRKMLAALIADGALRREVVDGVKYVWPELDPAPDEVPHQVRFLAPFDPVVWDRGRFEHLWGWSYRFEAYTPVKKRVRGYYAMPMLWRDRCVGWANIGARGTLGAGGAQGALGALGAVGARGALGARGAVTVGGLDVQLGFVDKTPRDRQFRRQLDAEVARLAEFLTPHP
jgi:hypothetical protein